LKPVTYEDLLEAAERVLATYGKGDEAESQALLDLAVAVDQLRRRSSEQSAKCP
jgi:hypothetical protein